MESKARTHRWFYTLAAAIGILLILVLITFIIAVSVTSSRLERTLAKLKSEGFRTSPKGVIPACPDDENAAPLWEKACQLISLKTREADKAYVKSYQDWPSLTPEDKKALREAVRANQQALDVLREAVSRPYFTVQPDYSKPMMTWQGPRLVSLSKVLRFLVSTRGRLALEDGNRPEALECCLLGIQSARSLSRYPDIVGSMLSLTAFNMTLSLCQETVADAPVPQEVALKMILILDPEFLKESIANGLDMLRLSFLDTTTRILAGERLGFLNPRFEPVMAFVTRPIIQSDATLLQEIMMREIKAIRGPYREAQKTFEEIANQAPNLSKIHYFARAQVAVLRGLPWHLADAEARAQVTRLALACKLYADKTGEFPVRLEQLTPDYFTELPLDPFTGKNFVYRRLPKGGFVLYSVGPDQHDDLSIYSSHDLQRMTFSTPDRPHDDVLWLEKPAR
jgi:hypothetical protein